MIIEKLKISKNGHIKSPYIYHNSPLSGSSISLPLLLYDFAFIKSSYITGLEISLDAPATVFLMGLYFSISFNGPCLIQVRSLAIKKQR